MGFSYSLNANLRSGNFKGARVSFAYRQSPLSVNAETGFIFDCESVSFGNVIVSIFSVLFVIIDSGQLADGDSFCTSHARAAEHEHGSHGERAEGVDKVALCQNRFVTVHQIADSTLGKHKNTPV
ncbi:MAG: hypothetical protein IKY97_06175 [Mailhella sp.]|nr:hypothetical protein [Mailhella sp.]